MKKIFLFLATVAVMMSSCYDADFVTVSHNGSEPQEEYYISEDRLFQSVVAAYDPLQWFDYFYQYNALNMVSDIMADDIYCGGSNEGDQPILVKTHYYTVTSIDVCNQIWTIAYSGVNRSCIVLEYADRAEGVSPEKAALYKAEAEVLKAYYYNMLWKFWGNIPYYDKNLTAPYFAEQLGHNEVYTKMVDNLEAVFEQDVLPMKAAAGNEGRVTKAMAYMLYAEIVMYQGDQSRYEKALGYMEEIIASNEYALVDDFGTIFTEAGEWCKESIWEINYISDGGVRSWDAPIATGGTVYPVLIGIPGGTSEYVDGWGFSPVAEHAWELYGENDKRRDATIYNHLLSTPDYLESGKARWQATGLFLNKYMARVNGNHGYRGDPNMNHGNNQRVYRYSETLLNAAELALATGKGGSNYLAEVRAARGSAETATDLDGILAERRIEFLGEGKRYWDLIRTGKAAEVLTAANHKYRPNNWTESKKYWPIPQSECDKDPNLDQNNY